MLHIESEFLCDIDEKCLRFYVSCDFIVSSTILNFVILQIKSIFPLNKIVSVDQVFFTIFSGKVSITWFCHIFCTFNDFSNTPSPTFWIMKNETFLLNFQNKWSFLQLQSHINPVLLRLLGCILPTCQLCKSYFAQTSGMASSTASQRYFALFESSSCFRPETRPRRHQKRFLSVINCLQFCTGKPLYHTIWDPFFAGTNPPLSVSME